MNIRVIRLLSEANIPIRYRYATLANYQVDKQNEAQLKEAKAYCEDILKSEQDSILSHGFSTCHENLIIIGNVGIGKTRLAISILRNFIEHGIEGVFYRISELLRAIKDTFDNPDNGMSGTKLIKRCCQIPFLIIDDLGCCRHTPWVDEVLDDIFSERSADGLPTLITSNLSESQLNKYLGDRVHSRLIKGGRIIPFTGDDKRPKKLKDIPSPEEIALWQAVDRMNKKSECTNQPEEYEDFIRIYGFSLDNAMKKNPSWEKFKSYYVDLQNQDIDVVRRAYTEYCGLACGVPLSKNFKGGKVNHKTENHGKDEHEEAIKGEGNHNA